MPFAPTPEIKRANLASVALFLKTLEREEGPRRGGRATERARRGRFGTRGPRPIAAISSAGVSHRSTSWISTGSTDRIGARWSPALRELYVVGAIDARGAATATGREMARVPAEPGLARAMVEARRRGCVDDVAAIAGMLGVERVYAGGDARDCEKAEEAVASAAEKKFGDLVPLLRVFRAWEATEPRLRGAFCERHGLSRRGMDAARDVRRHLAAAFSGTASRDPRPRGDDGDSDPPTTKNAGSSAAAAAAAFSDVRFCFCVGFANRLARRMPRHNGFRTLGRSSATAEVHPSSARAMADDASGLLPEWVAYGELVENANSSRPFLRNVCVVDPAWVAPLVARITESPNIANLRGGGGGRRVRSVRSVESESGDGGRGPSTPRARGETIKRRWRTRGGGTSSESERRRRRRRRSDA
jgi:ATP-dependent RNA helicase DHX8/PRP22